MKTFKKSQFTLSKVFFLFLLVLLYPATGFSLENERWSSGINFHFYPPGARALGMGGAFVGLADDATAAVSNPSGLAQLSRMQLAIEGRYASQDDKSTSFGWQDAYWQPGGTFSSNTSYDDVAEVSFGAFTTPVFNNLFNLAVFYNKPLSFGSEGTAVKTYNDSSLSYQYPGTTDISINEVGLSLAKGFLDGKLMIGAGLSGQFFDMKRTLYRYRISPDGRWPVDSPFTTSVTEENDAGMAWRFGILGKPIENLRLGASFTINPAFDYDVKIHNQVLNSDDMVSSEFDVPDAFSFGLAYNIFPNWVVIFEGKYVLYSQLENSFRIITGFGNESPNASDYSVDNIMELHFGTEYVLNYFPNIPIALRAGVFYEPAHDLKYNGAGDIQRNLFDGGEDLWHFTVGTGAVFFNHYQVDIGADFTESSRNVSLSMVYQF